MTGAAKPRVLHVVSRDAVGGCETACVNIVTLLQERGFRQSVAILAEPGPAGPVSAKLAGLGVAAHRCALPRRGRIAAMWRFSRLVRGFGTDAVLCYAYGVHLFVAIAARLGGARSIYGYAGNPPPLAGRGRWGGLVYANLARPFTAGDLACSDYVAGLMRRDYRLPASRVRRFYYPLDVAATRARAAAARATRAGQGPRIGMVARLDPIKDHRTVIAAFARFRQSHPDARLALVGDGPERGALEALAGSLDLGDSVAFLGDRSDVPEQLGLMDVFVYGTTREEGFGIVLAEAMAAGTPIVATDIGPCREVLDDGAAGLLVPAGDVEALANGLSRLFGDDGLRARLAAAAHGIATERHDLAGAGARFARLMEGELN